MMGLDTARSYGAARQSRLAAALLGTTILASLPVVVQAQATPAPQPADAQDAPAAAAQPQGVPIRSVQVVGSERLEPQTILSYVQLRAGQQYTAAAADQA